MAATAALLEEIEQLLGKQQFIPLPDLVRLGLYGSHSAALAAVKRGEIPIIRVTKSRFVVPRKAVLNFIRENFEENLRA